MVLPLAGTALKLVGLDVAIRAIDNLTTALTTAAGFSDKSQKASLALGMTFGTARDKLSGTMEDLRGTIEQKFTAGLMTLDAGLRGTQRGVGTLINQQQLTGTAYKGTAKAFGLLQRVMGLDIEASDAMALRLIENANRYQISTDVLVNSIQSLDRKMSDFAIMGMEAIPEAVTNLKASLGKPFEGRIDRIAKLLFDTGTKGLQTLSVLGLADFRLRIQQVGDDQAASSKILREAIVTAGLKLESFGVDAVDGGFALGAFKEVLGEGIGDFVTMGRVLREGAEVQNTAQVTYADTISTQISEIWNPLKDTIFDLYVVAFPLLKVAIGFVNEKIQQFTLYLKDAYVQGGGLSAVISRIKKIFEAMQPVLSALKIIFKANAIVGKVMRTIVMSLVDAYRWMLGDLVRMIKENEKLMEALPRWGAALKEAFLGFANWIAALLDKLSKVPGFGRFEGFGKQIRDALEGKKGEKRTPEVIEAAFKDQINRDANEFGWVQENEEKKVALLSDINDNTAKPSAFLEETTNLLRENMDRILGVSPRNEELGIFEEIRDFVGATALNTEDRGVQLYGISIAAGTT